MKHIQITRICDALVLALIVGVFASFSWVAGLVVAVVGFWLGFVFQPRRYPQVPTQDKDSAKQSQGNRQSWVWDPLDPINRHWHW